MAAAESTLEVDGIDKRALTQFLTVLEDQGRVRGCDDQFLVISESGSEYLVDMRLETCECPDHRFRDRECKHVLRVKYATGSKPVPPIVGPADVAGDLGEHVSGNPVWFDEQ